LLFGGKRKKIRRHEDVRRIFYVDHYSPRHFFTIVSILFLCVIDALLTLFLLNHGAYEVNPIMVYFLEFGPYTFFTYKYLLTIIPAIGLLMFRNVFLAPIRIYTHSLLYFIAVAFMAVVAWELYLVSIVMS
jgi:hypothetical protein